VLYMLVDYSERAHRLLYGPLSAAEREELYAVFRRIGEGLNIKRLPEGHKQWWGDRQAHLRRDLAFSRHTALLYEHYRRHLGMWRYQVLLQVQGLLVPERVRRLLRLRRPALLSALAGWYGVLEPLGLRPLVRLLLIHPRYWGEVDRFDRGAAAGL